MKSYENKILNSNTPFAVSEAYRTMRTNIMYSKCTDKCPVYAFTSAAPNEGKTLNCINTALSFAQIGKKVLVVDLDMRNPSQHLALETSNTNGVSEFLAGVSDEPNFRKTLYENLNFICGGRIPPDPSELLHSERLPMMIELAKKNYDMVFLDLPPVGIVSDAANISEYVSGYIIVLEADVSDMRLLIDATKMLETVGANIVGFLFNAVDPKNDKLYSAKYGPAGRYSAMYGDNGDR